MRTITAKELRDNIEGVVQRVRAGEHIHVTYRSKPAFTINPEVSTASNITPGSREAIGQYLQRIGSRKRATGKPIFDPEKSIKELYHEMLDNDPKYKPPYHRWKPV